MEKITQQLTEIETELKQQPGNARLWMDHGVGNHLIGEYDKAVKSFKQSLQLDNHNYKCHFNLANSIVELGMPEKAIHHYLEAIELQPDHIPSLNNLADAYDQAGQPEKAHEIFHYLIHLNPDAPLAHFNLGNFFLRNNQLVEAAKCYEKTIELDKTFVDAYYNIAWILKEVDAHREALSYVRDGLAVDPGYSDLRKLSEELTVG